jgi:hypothetical protein
MTAYLIAYGQDPSDRFAAYSFPDRITARLASLPVGAALTPGVPPGSHAGGCAYVIETEADVTFSGQLLVDVFNALTESGVKKFESRAIGMKRLMAVLATTARDGSALIPAAEVSAVVIPPTKENKVSDTNGRAPKHPTTSIINLLADKNPKRDGSAAHGRFAAYQTGMTVEAALAAGVTRGDLAYDAKHGYIEVKPAG